MKDIKCHIPEIVSNEIVFCPSGSDWSIKINESGIFFNREKYPNANPDDFVQAFIDILENSYVVRFERKYPHYDK